MISDFGDIRVQYVDGVCVCSPFDEGRAAALIDHKPTPAKKNAISQKTSAVPAVISVPDATITSFLTSRELSPNHVISRFGCGTVCVQCSLACPYRLYFVWASRFINNTGPTFIEMVLDSSCLCTLLFIITRSSAYQVVSPWLAFRFGDQVAEVN
jgi:hypothetical protein